MRHIAVALGLALAMSSLAFAGDSAKPSAAAGAAPAAAGKKVSVKVTDDGFQPREIRLKKGQPATLEFTRVTDATCITELDIPAEGVKEFALPLNKTVSLTVTPKKAGI